MAFMLNKLVGQFDSSTVRQRVGQGGSSTGRRSCLTYFLSVPLSDCPTVQLSSSKSGAWPSRAKPTTPADPDSPMQPGMARDDADRSPTRTGVRDFRTV